MPAHMRRTPRINIVPIQVWVRHGGRPPDRAWRLASARRSCVAILCNRQFLFHAAAVRLRHLLLARACLLERLVAAEAGRLLAGRELSEGLEESRNPPSICRRTRSIIWAG